MEESKLKHVGRVLGIDYGKRYVGVAISDPLFLSAQGLEIIERARPDKQRQTLARLCHICEEYEVESIVIGFPKNMDGTENERCIYTRDFADLLYNRVQLPIYFWDERLTTISAEATLDELGKKDTKSYVDKIAAMMILQGYMDSVHNGVESTPYKF